MIVTTDFDHTLLFEIGGVNHETLNLISLHKLAHPEIELIVISSRYDTEENKEEIREFCRKNDLEIVAIILTGEKDKFPFLKTAKSEIHFEDDVIEISMINSAARAEGYEIEVVRCLNMEKWQAYQDSL